MSVCGEGGGRMNSVKAFEQYVCSSLNENCSPSTSMFGPLQLLTFVQGLVTGNYRPSVCSCMPVWACLSSKVHHFISYGALNDIYSW